MSNAYIPARHFRTLLQLLEEQNHPTQPIVEGLGLPDGFSQQSQEGFLTLEQVQTLISRAVAVSQSECLGVYLGQRLNLSAHGVVGFAGLSAATIGDALKVAQRFQPLVMPLIELNIDKSEHLTWVSAHTTLALPQEVEKFLLDALLASIYTQGSYLYLGSFQKVTAYLPYFEAQYDGGAKAGFSEVAIEYGADRLRFSFPNELISTPLALADEQTHQHALRQCEAMLEAMPRPGGLGQTLRQQLLQEGPPFPTLQQLAQQRHMSERTLRRHLNQENISWRDLLTEVKMNKAKHYLMAGHDSITTIALRLGYQDSANFSRAFRQYTGLSPSQWRQY